MGTPSDVYTLWPTHRRGRAEPVSDHCIGNHMPRRRARATSVEGKTHMLHPYVMCIIRWPIRLYAHRRPATVGRPAVSHDETIVYLSTYHASISQQTNKPAATHTHTAFVTSIYLCANISRCSTRVCQGTQVANILPPLLCEPLGSLSIYKCHYYVYYIHT